MSSYSSEQTTGPDGKGSLFCSYNETSSNYNSTRRPLGLGAILGAICMNGHPLSEVKLLDIGCGTGSFVKEVWPKLKHTTGLEINDGMLSQAKATLKVALEAGRVELVQSAAIDLPFGPNTFDAVTINVVIHHFPKENNFAYLKQVFKNVFKVLKPGGCFVLNQMLPKQDMDGFWFAALIPKAMKDISDRSPPFEVLMKHFLEVGFTVDEGEIMTPLRGTYQVPYLEKYGIDGAFVQEYRDGDSTWAIAEASGELETCKSEIRRMHKDGSAKSWLEEREAIRKLIGQTTIFVARKPRTFFEKL